MFALDPDGKQELSADSGPGSGIARHFSWVGLYCIGFRLAYEFFSRRIEGAKALLN